MTNVHASNQAGMLESFMFPGILPRVPDYAAMLLLNRGFAGFILGFCSVSIPQKYQVHSFSLLSVHRYPLGAFDIQP